MNTQRLEYTNGKSKFIGYLAVDGAAGGRRPGVVVFPEAFGLNDHAPRPRPVTSPAAGFICMQFAASFASNDSGSPRGAFPRRCR